MPKCKVRLTICGTDYLITADDEENYVRAIGKEVEKAIEESMDSNDRISVTMAAVLTALSYCDTANKANISADNLRAQIKEYLTDASRYRTECDEAHREIERLKKENASLLRKLNETSSSVGKAEPIVQPSKAALEHAAQQQPVQPLKGQQSFSQVTAPSSNFQPPMADKKPKEITPDEFMSFFDNLGAIDIEKKD